MANQTSPFAKAAPTMLAHGLAPLPLGGESGKQPLISGFNHWPKPPTAVAILRFAKRFPDANVGLVCHASNLVVVDIDTPDQLDRVEELFGPSPLVVDTPSGGSHRYFRNSEGIGCLNLRSAGLDVDIKGQGGIVACPPSVSRVSGKPYRFREGNWGKLADLPTLSRSHVEAVVRRHPTNGHRDAPQPPRHTQRPPVRLFARTCPLAELGRNPFRGSTLQSDAERGARTGLQRGGHRPTGLALPGKLAGCDTHPDSQDRCSRS